MNGNFNRNSLEHQATGTRILNHNKPFQDKGIKRYKNRSLQINDKEDFKNPRNNKIKKNYKYDDQLKPDSNLTRNNSEHSDHKVESFPYRTFNGDMTKNTTYLTDRKPLRNSSLNDCSKIENDGSKRNFLLKDTSAEKYKMCDYKAEGNKSNPVKDTNAYRREKSNVKLKLNFLQESQLNSDKCESSSDKNSCVHSSHKAVPINGLNPAAVEFTPSSVTATPVIQQITDVIEDGFKSLSLAAHSTTHSTMTDSSVVTPDYAYVNQQPITVFPDQSYSGKLGFIDPSLVQGFYQCPSGRQISRMNYPQPMITPQFQMTLYNPNQQLIRYNNSAQNVPGNYPGNYIVCNPIMLNGLYNQCQNPVSFNRFIQLNAGDIPVGNLSSSQNIAHQFNPNVNLTTPYPPYYQDSSVNSGLSHIR